MAEQTERPYIHLNRPVPKENIAQAIAQANMGLIDRAQATWHRICEMAPYSPQAQHARSTLGQE